MMTNILQEYIDINLDVINFHFLDCCNFCCKHCFVKKENNILPLDKVKHIIDNIMRYFHAYNIKGRINLVGGEVFLCSYLQEIIDYIFENNLEVSLVTNGFLLTGEFIEYNREKIKTIGLSIDSINDKTNQKIGRCTDNKSTLIIDKVYELCEHIKNNDVKLKVNICVSKHNINDDFHDFIANIQPDRLKIFQLLVIKGINDSSKKYTVNNSEFNKFVKKLSIFNPVIEKSEDMINSYIMVDSKGDLFFDKSKDTFGNLLTDDFCELIKNKKINRAAYNKRYQ